MQCSNWKKIGTLTRAERCSETASNKRGCVRVGPLFRLYGRGSNIILKGLDESSAELNTHS